DINKPTEKMSSEEILHHFLSINKDILTTAELRELVNHKDRSKALVVSCAATIFGHLLKCETHKTLLVIDEHGILFNNDPSPVQFPVLYPLMDLPTWGGSAA